MADNSIESVHGISGVVDHSAGTIGFQQTVLSLYDISIAGLVLVLEVSGQTVLDVVGVVVLWVVIVLVDFLAENRLGSIGQRCLDQSRLGSIRQRSGDSVGHIGGGWGSGQKSGSGQADQGEEADKLEEKKLLRRV